MDRAKVTHKHITEIMHFFIYGELPALSLSSVDRIHLILINNLQHSQHLNLICKKELRKLGNPCVFTSKGKTVLDPIARVKP